MQVDRVCHIIGSLQHGGAERQFINILNNLPVKNRFAIILSQKTTSGFIEELNPEITVLYVPIRIRTALWHLMKTAMYLRKNNIQFVQTHMNWANIYGSIAAFLAGVRNIVCTFHGANEYDKKGVIGVLYHVVHRYLVRRIARLGLAVSCEIKECIIAKKYMPRDRIFVMPNAVPIPIIDNFSRERPRNLLSIGVVGRLVPEKGFIFLLNAIQLISTKQYQFEVSILGNGPLMAELTNRINSQHLNQTIFLRGMCKDVSAWYKQFDLFVMSSISEGEPMALLEAMSYGLPVVATRVGAIPVVVRDGIEGILVEPGDVNGLAKAIVRMLEDKSLRESMGTNARKRIIETRSIEILVQRYLELYAKMKVN